MPSRLNDPWDIAWAVSDSKTRYIGPIHLADLDTGQTACGHKVKPMWVSRAPGLFFKRKTLDRGEALCADCLTASGGRGPINRVRR